jgi:hypothetical protein
MNALLRLLRRAWLLAHCLCCEGADRFCTPLLLRARGVVFGKAARFHGMPVIARNPSATIVIGDEVVLNSRPSSNVLYLSRPCVLAATKPGAVIRIGNKVGMSGSTLIAASGIEIGDHTLIGAEVAIVDTDFHPLDPDMRDAHETLGAATRPIRIGKRVFIGTRAIILKGVSIADDAVVGAGAVVSRDVAAGDIVAGNPARIVGSVRESEQARPT